MKNQTLLLSALLALAGCGGNDLRSNSGQPISGSSVSAAMSPSTSSKSEQRNNDSNAGSAKSIASAPDNGQLLNYRHAVPSRQEGGSTWYPVTLSEEHAFSSIAGGELHFITPDGSQLRIRHLRHMEQQQGNWTWIGQVVGGEPGKNAIITFGPKAVFGSIPLPGKPPLQLQTRDGQLYVVALDPTRAKRPDWGDDAIVPQMQATKKSHRQINRHPASSQASTVAGTAASSSTTIDILLGYTPGLATRLGSDSAAITRLNYLVEYGNQALANSDVVGRLRLVGTSKVAYTDNSTNNDTLTALREGTDPAMASLHTKGAQLGADLTLLVRNYTTEHDSCGVAYVLGGNGSEITSGDAAWAYGVVSDGAYTSGNSTWYCSDSTLIHEGGHLLGSTHDRANSGSPGRYPYSYGYNANGVCDVMAYCNSENTEYQVFSNPRIMICGSKACGIENSEDNARSLNQTIPIISTFRATVVPFEPSLKLHNDFNGDGSSDIFWRNLSSGQNVVWNDANFGNLTYPGNVSSSNWLIVGAGDFDNDGKSDLLWRNSTTGQNSIWPSAKSSMKRNATTVTNQDWKVAAVDDFNGDGQADIFWRNAATGQNVIWWSGEYAGATTESSIATSWLVAGAADVNGDGKSDLVWRNTTTGRNIVWWSGRHSGFTYLTSVTNQSWMVVALGDLNGDGKADLFWRDANSGQNIIWWSGNGATRTSETAVSTTWKVVATGDYNNDGDIDLLWRNSTTGTNAIWNSGRYATSRSITGVSNLMWQVQQ